ncbi:MAG: adenosylcobinamide-phosphate synthase CbiB [Desulfuromonadales bacterium]
MSGVELVAAFGLDLWLGDPRRIPHPVVAIGRLVTLLEGVLYESGLSLRMAGAFLACGVLLVTCLVAAALIKVAGSLHLWLGFLATVWLAYTCLAVRELHCQTAMVVDALDEGDLVSARSHLGMIVGRDTAQLDEPGILRACIETMAENTSDGIVAPLFYLAVGGPVGGLLYKAVNTMDSMIGYRNNRYLEFGWAAARLDDLLNWLPARLTALLMVVASFLLNLNGWQGWRIMWRDAHNHASPNAGYPEAVAAGALGIQLGGSCRYFGKELVKATLGDADRVLDVSSFRNMLHLMYTTSLLALILLAGALWLF